MKVGFTGTREGMSGFQKRIFWGFITLHSDEIEEFHHGDCLGADAEAHAIVREILPKVTIVIHPPINPGMRAFCGRHDRHTVNLPPKPYLDRNKDIVDLSEFLVAGPRADAEELRSGTWSTVRYGYKQKRRVMILKRELEENR